MYETKSVVAGRRLAVVALFGGVAVAAQPVLGGDVPDVEMTIVLSDGFAMTFNPVGTDVGGGTYNYVGVINAPGDEW